MPWFEEPHRRDMGRGKVLYIAEGWCDDKCQLYNVFLLYHLFIIIKMR
jgi:hypothetical protein